MDYIEMESKEYVKKTSNSDITFEKTKRQFDNGETEIYTTARISIQSAKTSTFITGHGMINNRGYIWYRIFYKGPLIEKKDASKTIWGCNSVYCADGTWKNWEFEPCEADSDTLLPFSKETVMSALEELDQVNTIDEKDLIYHTRYNEEKESREVVFNKNDLLLRIYKWLKNYLCFRRNVFCS